MNDLDFGCEKVTTVSQRKYLKTTGHFEKFKMPANIGMKL